jgi:hypothetical protein
MVVSPSHQFVVVTSSVQPPRLLFRFPAEGLAALLATVLVHGELLTGTGFSRGIDSGSDLKVGFSGSGPDVKADFFESEPRPGVPTATEPSRPPDDELDRRVLPALSIELSFIADESYRTVRE